MNDAFRHDLETVERFRRQGDYYNANGRLLEAVCKYLRERYPFEVSRSSFGASIHYNGQTLGVVAVVVHGLIKGRTKLEDIQRSEIAKVLSELNSSSAKLRMLVVRDLPIKHAVVRDLEDHLHGVEVWTTDDLSRFDLPIRG